MNDADFIEGKYDTHFIEERIDSLMAKKDKCNNVCEDIALVTAFLDYVEKISKNETTVQSSQENSSGWKQYGRRTGLMRF